MIDSLNMILFANSLAKAISEEYKVKVLDMMHAGSRAWGYASEESDYDLFFVYLDKPENLLFGKPAVINVSVELIDKVKKEHKIKDDVSIVGFELSKAITLACKPNWNMYCYLNTLPLLNGRLLDPLRQEVLKGVAIANHRSAYLKQLISCLANYRSSTTYKGIITRMHMLRMIYSVNHNDLIRITYEIPFDRQIVFNNEVSKVLNEYTHLFDLDYRALNKEQRLQTVSGKDIEVTAELLAITSKLVQVKLPRHECIANKPFLYNWISSET